MKNLMPQDELLKFIMIMAIIGIVAGMIIGGCSIIGDYVNKDVNKATIEAGLEQDDQGHWKKRN